MSSGDIINSSPSASSLSPSLYIMQMFIEEGEAREGAIREELEFVFSSLCHSLALSQMGVMCCALRVFSLMG